MPRPDHGSERPDPRTREVFFDGDWVETDVYDRSSLPPEVDLETPAIVEDATATAVIGPGAAARTDPHGNLVVEGVGR